MVSLPSECLSHVLRYRGSHDYCFKTTVSRGVNGSAMSVFIVEMTKVFDQKSLASPLIIRTSGSFVNKVILTLKTYPSTNHSKHRLNQPDNLAVFMTE